jgi:tripartite-type tricarboxylate transporter receptor subunit TctC
VPAAAGSAIDVIPRIVFEQLSIQLGQPIIVETRVGAGTTIGTAAVAKAEPDGYTILVNSSALTVSPSVYPNLPYSPVRDLSAIIPIGSLPNVLIVSPSKGYKTVGELVAAARVAPGSINFASTGVGAATHMSAERFRLSAGFEAVHIPFKGGPEAMTEVLTGRVHYYFCPVGTALPYIRDGRLGALVVSTPKRSSALPDVPTTLEAGFADSDYTFWMGMFAPKNTPRYIVEKLYLETEKALRMASVRAKLEQLGVEPLPMNPEEFDAHVEKELRMNDPLIKALGLGPN